MPSLRSTWRHCGALSLALIAVGGRSISTQVRIAGELRQWHRVELQLDGPTSGETATTNPFLDYRMQVEFRHVDSGAVYRVAGYFAADGRAADSSADTGDQWRALLSPDRVGQWRYAISFRRGVDIAVSDDPQAGTAVAPFDGLTGTFAVTASDKGGRDHRGKGRLRYVGRHHLQFANGEWFFKVGADSPENLLAYEDFDNTPNTGSRRKSWSPHVRDWQAGDPTWKNGRGKGLVGALNYLSGKGMNVFSFLPYSFNGDDKNVFPYRVPADRLRMDCSKLDQWEVVFSHADRVGLYLHFKLQETENDQNMDGGRLGTERKLYYREVVARFGHHLALNWNLGEENTNTDAQRKQFAQWFADHDPYRHLVVVHTYPGQKDQVYRPMLGSASELTGASLQCGPTSVFGDTLTWRNRSAAAGKPWVVANDEQGNANAGIRPDADDPTHDASRRDVLWGHLTAGGAGVESYFGYRYAHSDLTCQDWRSRDVWWDQCRHALTLLRTGRVPFQDMANRDALVSSVPSGSHCLAGAGFYLLYLANGQQPSRLDLTGEASSASFEVRWFDPRAGGALQTSSVPSVSGGALRLLGTPPNASAKDWVVLVRPRASRGVLRSYGAGCAGTGGRVPQMGATGLPFLGSPLFTVRVRSARANASAAMLLGGMADSQRLPGGCVLWVSQPLALTVQTDSAGAARLPLPIPVDARLLSASVFASAAVRDPNGAFLGVAALANGLEARIGY